MIRRHCAGRSTGASSAARPASSTGTSTRGSSSRTGRATSTRPAASRSSYLVKLFTGLPWYRLVPDQKHTLLTSGYGTFSSTGNVESSDYATAARTPDGKLAIAYLPTVRTITIDASKLAANAVSRWYDPTAGTFTPAAPLSRNGSIETFRPPDKNSAGDGDWLLVLTAG